MTHTCNDLSKFTLPITRNSERDAMKRIATTVVVATKIFYVQHNIVCLCRCFALYTREFHISAHHHAGEVTFVSGRGIDSANSAATAQNGNAI